MEHRRGRRLSPRFPWRRAAVPIVALLALTLATAAAVNRAAPQARGGARSPVAPLLRNFPSRTPEDDVGAFADPTPSTAPTELGGTIAVTAGLRGPSITLPILLYHYI